MDTEFDDRLEVLGLVTGALLVLGGLATIAGQPWATMGDTAAAVGQVLGALVTIAVGVALAWIARLDATAA